jgi:hypothetical protein
MHTSTESAKRLPLVSAGTRSLPILGGVIALVSL